MKGCHGVFVKVFVAPTSEWKKTELLKWHNNGLSDDGDN
jgi:hypothetical protein